jgi:hypothetical protein
MLDYGRSPLVAPAPGPRVWGTWRGSLTVSASVDPLLVQCRHALALDPDGGIWHVQAGYNVDCMKSCRGYGMA